MNILMLLEYNFPGDVRVDREVESLNKAGLNIDVAICTKNPQLQKERKFEWGTVYSKYISKSVFKFSALALSFPFYFNFWESFISKIIEKNNYSYIHLHDLPLVKVAYKVSQKYNIPLVLDLHENRPEIMKIYKHVNTFPGKFLISLDKWAAYQKKYVNLVDHLILITNEAKNYYIEEFGVEANKISVVPNFANLPLPLEEYDQKLVEKYKSKKTLIYFGDISTRRGIIELINVAIKQKDNPTFHFVFIGAGTGVTDLKEIIEKENLSNVDILGYIPMNKAFTIIEACSIGVCPFHRNIHHDTTYANKMYQYMALGLPLIVSDCPAQATIVKEENAGVIFTAGDSEDLNNKLLELVNDNDEFTKMSKRNIELVNDKYNWANGAKELINIYKS